MKPARRIFWNCSIADNTAGTGASQIPFRRKIIRLRSSIGPFPITPLGSDHIIGKVLRGEHGNGGVMNDDKSIRPDPLTRPFHEIEKFIYIPVTGGFLARLLAFVERVLAEEGDVPIVVDAVKWVVFEHPVN